MAALNFPQTELPRGINGASDLFDESPVLKDEFFTAAPPPSGGSQIRVWTGSAWELKPLLRWNGSAWVAATLNRWNGSAWVAI
jgi:hypothetical protein